MSNKSRLDRRANAFGFMLVRQILNPKHQISNKSQISIFNNQNRTKIGHLYLSSLACSFFETLEMFGILNFGHCYLFVICDLSFEIFHKKQIIAITALRLITFTLASHNRS